MSTGRTYGNQVMGLRIVNNKGQRLHPFAAIVRAALRHRSDRALWVLVSGQNRSLQDLVLRTSVIDDWDVRPLHPPVQRRPEAPDARPRGWAS